MEHPLVCIHHETGRKVLWVTGPYGVRFKDMTEEESKPLLEYLNQHATSPEFTCRFRWGKGSVAVWDNRATQHNAIGDYSGYRREMHRTMTIGERPYGPAR
jgi:taurine dioxygenase